MTPAACKEAMAALEAWIGDPHGGVPEEFFLFLTRFTPMVNVDLWIRDARNRTLLTWREDATYGAGWHIPGGIIRFQETAEARILATARRELGAEVDFDPLPVAIGQMIDPARKNRGHFVSLLYRCRLTGPLDETLRFTSGRPKAGQWAWHEHCPVDLIPAQASYRRFL